MTLCKTPHIDKGCSLMTFFLIDKEISTGRRRIFSATAVIKSVGNLRVVGRSTCVVLDERYFKGPAKGWA